jgi:alpha-1,3-mannosyltransferase
VGLCHVQSRAVDQDEYSTLHARIGHSVATGQRHSRVRCCMRAWNGRLGIAILTVALVCLLSCLQRFGVWRTIPRLLLIVLIQLILATPFLLVHPGNYFHCAFNFDRAFFYIWTVNLKVLSEEVFLSQELAKGLLGAHVLLMVVFLHKMSVAREGGRATGCASAQQVPSLRANSSLHVFAYLLSSPRRLDGGLIHFIRDMLHSLMSPTAPAPPKSQHPSAGYIVTLMFIMNFIGIVCARSLHYQVRPRQMIVQ